MNMKFLKYFFYICLLATTLSTLVGCAVLAPGYIPTPDSAIGFNMDKDSRIWGMQYSTANSGGFTSELVPQGETIKAWKEMVQIQTVFSPMPLRQFVDGWKKLMLQADPLVTINEESMADGSILVSYTSVFADETSVRKFIKGSDGIYMIAYHVRPKLKNDDKFNIWSDIIRSAHLGPNPEKGK
jgi:hypothetical protein